MAESLTNYNDHQPNPKPRRVLIRVVDPGSVPPTIVIPGWSSEPIQYPIDAERLADIGLGVAEDVRFFGRIDLAAETAGQLCLHAESYEAPSSGEDQKSRGL